MLSRAGAICTPVILATWEDSEIEASLGSIARPCPNKEKKMLGTVAHTCNSSYLGGEEWEDHSLKISLGKKLARSHLNQ
jgi:hypothetical protein